MEDGVKDMKEMMKKIRKDSSFMVSGSFNYDC